MSRQSARLNRLEKRIGEGRDTPAARNAYLTRMLEDWDFLKEEVRLHPGKPGSREEQINGELLALGPWDPADPVLGAR